MKIYTFESYLLKCIEELKATLMKTAKRTGINSNETIKCSQELDILLNLHLKYFSNKGKLRTAS